MIAAIGIVAVVIMFAIVARIAWDDGKKHRTDPLKFDPVAHDRNVILGRANSAVERSQLVTVTLPTPGIANHRPVASFAPAADRTEKAEVESEALMLELARTELYRPTPEDNRAALAIESAPAPIWEAPVHSHESHSYDHSHSTDTSHSHDSSPSFDHSSSGGHHGGHES